MINDEIADVDRNMFVPVFPFGPFFLHAKKGLFF